MAMQNIGPLSSTPPRIGDAYAQESEKKTGQPAAGADGATPRANPDDRAEISASGRKLVDLRTAYRVGQRALETVEDLRPEKIAQARERLASGFYHSATVQEETAGKLLSVMESLERL